MSTANYFVFARKEYQQPLEWIGQLAVESRAAQNDAPTAELIQRAREQFGGEAWVEMVAIPEAVILRVIPVEME